MLALCNAGSLSSPQAPQTRYNPLHFLICVSAFHVENILTQVKQAKVEVTLTRRKSVCNDQGKKILLKLSLNANLGKSFMSKCQRHSIMGLSDVTSISLKQKWIPHCDIIKKHCTC
jgi:hypothetical protein